MMLDILIEQMHSPDSTIREQAVRQLGNSHFPEAFKPLSEALYDSDIKVRRAAVHALGELGDLRAVDLLVEFSKNEDFAVFEEDIQLNPGPIEHVLVGFGTRAVETLLTLLKGNDSFVVGILGQIGDVRAFEPLIDIVQHSNDVYYRQAAICALGQLRDNRALDVLISLAHSPVPELKMQAISALGDLGDPRAVDILCEFLFIPSPHPQYIDFSHHFHYASAAAHALGTLAHEDALVALLNHAQTPNALYRTLTFQELISVNDPRVEVLFSEAIHDPDDDTGWYTAIQYFRNKGGTELLEELRKQVPPKPAQAIATYPNGLRSASKW